MSQQTDLFRLAKRAKQVGVGARAVHLFTRLTTITGPDDPELAEKLAGLPELVADYIIRELCVAIDEAP